MARTGRFGRLPTAAPDLSSQIVSLMEQWQNAEDANILDAWQNGGKYKGSKVTDRRILNHYRKRRDSYDRDDPEWDDWNNELWQMRFRVSNETVMMNYRMGRIGEAAVARHYREWARKMPRNSSYYRNMMQSAGEFAKAASAGRAAAGKEFDYNAMMRRVNSHNKPIRAQDALFGILNEYAIHQNIIEPGQSVFDAGSLYIGDLGYLMHGVAENDPRWGTFVESIQKDFPDFNGVLTWDKLNRLTNRAIEAKRAQIAEYKKAPFDTASIRAGLRADIKSLQAVKRLQPYANTMERVKESTVEWTRSRADAAIGESPEAMVEADADHLDDLNKAYTKLMSIGGTTAREQAGDIAARILALSPENKEWLDANPQWRDAKLPDWMTDQSDRQSGDTDMLGMTQAQNEELRNETGYMWNAIKQLKDRTVFLVRDPNRVSDVSVSIGQPPQQDWKVQEFPIDRQTGVPKLNDPGMAAYTGFFADGSSYQEALTGTPIYGEQQQILGYEFTVEGMPIYKLRDPSDPTHWEFTWDDSVFPNGLQRSGDGLVPVLEDPNNPNATYGTYASRAGGLFERGGATDIVGATPNDPLSMRFGSGRPPDAPPDATQAEKDQRKREQRIFDAMESSQGQLTDRGITDPEVQSALIDESGELVLTEVEQQYLEQRVGELMGQHRTRFGENQKALQDAIYRHVLRTDMDYEIPITADDSRFVDTEGNIIDWQDPTAVPPVRPEFITQPGVTSTRVDGEQGEGGVWEQIGGQPVGEIEEGTTVTYPDLQPDEERPEGWAIDPNLDAYSQLQQAISFTVNNEAVTFTSLDSAVASRSSLTDTLTPEKMQAYARTFLGDSTSNPDLAVKNIMEMENQLYLADVSEQQQIIGKLNPDVPADTLAAATILGDLNKRKEQRQVNLYPIFEALGSVPDELGPAGAESFNTYLRTNQRVPSPTESYLPQPLSEAQIDRISEVTKAPTLDITKPIEVTAPKVPPPPSLQAAVKAMPAQKIPSVPPPPSIASAVKSLPPTIKTPPPPPTIESAMATLRNRPI